MDPTLQLHYTALQHYGSANHWGAIWPELSLGCLALFLLVLETVLPRAARGGIPAMSIVCQSFILAVLLGNLDLPVTTVFNGLLVLSSRGQVMRVFFLLTSIL